jgi:D-tyrosyl-tRNA(Tyr) deacylase
MKAVIQRVKQARVTVDKQEAASVSEGFLVLFAVHRNDEKADIDYMVNKILNLRIFEDENHKANLSVRDIEGEILLVPQFTLISSTRKGNRPSFTDAADYEKAKAFSELFFQEMKMHFNSVKYGVFRAYMQVSLVNDGPFTIIIDSLDRQSPRRQA